MHKEFEINLVILKDEETFEYQIDASFFKSIEGSEIETGQINVALNLIKGITHLQADFNVDGYIQLVCDRSLEEFDFPIHFKEQHIYKFGEGNKEIDENVTQLDHGTDAINIAGLLYDLIGVQVPYKKLHPKFNDEDSDDDLLIYADQVEEEEEEEQSSDIDPRWEALKNVQSGDKN